MLSRKFAIRTISKALLILSSLIGRDIRFKVASGALADGGRFSPGGAYLSYVTRTDNGERDWKGWRGEGGLNFDRGPVQKEVAVRRRYVTRVREEIYADQKL